MDKSLISIIDSYILGITKDEFHRYKSWDNCFKAFGNSSQNEIHVLELAFYLASWGMYRGSSGLLQKNHLIHKGAVDIIFSKAGQALNCNNKTEVSRQSIIAVLQLKNQLAKHYKAFPFTRGSEVAKPISPTATLLSKIMLGTLGCVPAYDRYFIEGLKEMKMTHTSFSSDSLNELFNFIDKNKSEIEQAQRLIKTKTGTHYPLMKILDMYFWQIGYDKDIKEKAEKKGK